MFSIIYSKLVKFQSANKSLRAWLAVAAQVDRHYTARLHTADWEGVGGEVTHTTGWVVIRREGVRKVWLSECYIT